MKINLRGPGGRYLLLVSDFGCADVVADANDPPVQFVVANRSSINLSPCGVVRGIANLITRGSAPPSPVRPDDPGFLPVPEMDAVVRALGYEARRRRTRKAKP
ncbi:MAG: hypothetical protein JXB32_24850 [Deltaproteobacteria bacterium]|nr:hypothetical protein [Deltaproteobacteria bacterium]